MTFLTRTNFLLLLSVTSVWLCSPLKAWDLVCEIDAFTDEESCTIKHEEDFVSLLVTHDKSSGQFMLSLMDPAKSPRFDDTTFMLRVDKEQVMDLKESGSGLATMPGLAVAVLPAQTAKEVFDEIANGAEIRIRLMASPGVFKDYAFSAVGFSETWRRAKTHFNISSQTQ